MTMYEHGTEPTSGLRSWRKRSRRKRLHQYASTLRPFVQRFEPLFVLPGYRSHTALDETQDNTAYLVAHIVQSGWDAQREYAAQRIVFPTDSVASKWRLMYKHRLFRSPSTEQVQPHPVHVHTVVNRAPEYRLIGGLRAKQVTNTLNLSSADWLFVQDVTGNASSIQFPQLRHTAQSILLWLRRHGVLHTALNHFATHSNACTKRQRERYGIESATLALILHVVASCQEAAAQYAVDRNVPWAWQEPLFVHAVLSCFDDRERVHYLVQQVQRGFREVSQNTLQER